MHGTLSIEISSGRPKLHADLHSQLLRLGDLGERAAGRAAASEAAKPLLLPDTALRLAGIRRDDSTVNFHAHSVEVGRVTLHAVPAHDRPRRSRAAVAVCIHRGRQTHRPHELRRDARDTDCGSRSSNTTLRAASDLRNSMEQERQRK